MSTGRSGYTRFVKATKIDITHLHFEIMTYSIGSSSLSLYVFSFLASIGCLVFVHISFTLFRGIYARLLRPGKNIKLVYGSWAVITGATDGIGKGMAFELARKGLNIFLISRSEEKLKQTSDELEKKYPNIQVKYLSVDYADFNDSMKEKVSEATKYLEVGVLVNNVGISYPFTKYFDELSNENVEQLIRLNVDSTTWMTRIFLPGMKSRGRGAVVNIGSAAGVSISPLLAQYGAAKSYIAMFSKALNYEMKGSVSAMPFVL